MCNTTNYFTRTNQNETRTYLHQEHHQMQHGRFLHEVGRYPIPFQQQIQFLNAEPENNYKYKNKKNAIFLDFIYLLYYYRCFYNNFILTIPCQVKNMNKCKKFKRFLKKREKERDRCYKRRKKMLIFVDFSQHSNILFIYFQLKNLKRKHTM